MRVVVRAMRKLFSLTLGFVALLYLCAPSWAQTKDSVLQFQLSDQLKQSAAKWNRGDLAGFMEDYLHSEELTFTSGGQTLRGYNTLKSRYEKNYGQSRESMGQLSFSDVEVWKLAEGRALVVGRWKVDRQEAGVSAPRDGVFTLVMVQQGNAWKIFHDHTSMAAGR